MKGRGSRRAMRVTMAGALLALSLPTPGSAQLLPVPNGASPVRVAQWVGLAFAHNPGTADAAATEALSFSPKELAGILYAFVMARVPVDRAELSDLLARGAILHTDIAAAQLSGAQRADEVSRGGSAATHLATAEWLVGYLAARDRSHSLVRPWFVAAGALLLSELEVATTPAFLDRALAACPEDPQLLLMAGAARELRASSRVQDAQDLSYSVHQEIGDAVSNLRAAGVFYRLALKAAPTHVEPRIHLGRVLALGGQHVEALSELEIASRALNDAAADSGAADRPLRYYLALLLGEEQEALGRVEEARRSLALALTLYPGAVAPWLILSRLEWRGGAREAAAAAVVRMADAGSPSRRAADSWKDYFCAGPARDVPSALRAMAAAVGDRR